MITLTSCYVCRLGPGIEQGEVPFPGPPPLEGEGICAAHVAQLYREALTEEDAIAYE